MTPRAQAAGPVQHLGIVGGGTMGAGICQVALLAGARVTLVEDGQAAAVAARGRIEAGLAAAARRTAPLKDTEQYLSALTVLPVLRIDAELGLVIESVPEDLALKQSVLTAIEAKVGPDTVLASNTSALSISALASVLRHPERFAGIHFFNPVPASALIEVVRGSRTSPLAVQAARGLAQQLGKEVVEVADSPGFATSRLGVLLGLEAIRMCEDSVASAADIDRAIVLGYKHPIGPLRLCDLVGLDVRLAIAEDLAKRLGSRFEPPPLMRQMVAQGLLGKKSGQGFYSWPAPATGTA